MKNCPYCGQYNKDQAIICGHCKLNIRWAPLRILIRLMVIFSLITFLFVYKDNIKNKNYDLGNRSKEVANTIRVLKNLLINMPGELINGIKSLENFFSPPKYLKAKPRYRLRAKSEVDS